MKNDFLTPVEKLMQEELKLRSALRLIKESDPNQLCKVQVFDSAGRSKTVNLSTTNVELALSKQLRETEYAVTKLRSKPKPAHWHVHIDLDWDYLTTETNLNITKLTELLNFCESCSLPLVRTRKEARELLLRRKAELTKRLVGYYKLDKKAYSLTVRRQLGT